MSDRQARKTRRKWRIQPLEDPGSSMEVLSMSAWSALRFLTKGTDMYVSIANQRSMLGSVLEYLDSLVELQTTTDHRMLPLRIAAETYFLVTALEAMESGDWSALRAMEQDALKRATAILEDQKRKQASLLEAMNQAAQIS